MAIITKAIESDEKTWQGEFYRILFGDDLDGIAVDRSTDGYTRGIIFEHKSNVRSYGESKALSQALIYLTRFNRDGIPVPAKICLVGQEEQKCYIYETKNYMHIVNNIPKYANIKASDGIPGFSAGSKTKVITFDMSSPLRGMQDVLSFVQEAPQNVKVDINVHNVYGWANFYYDNANEYKQKPEKKKFFEELRNPEGTLEAFINPWLGQETDFKYIMDMLNDPMTQKKLGAFYTPPSYAKKATELVMQAIKRVPEGNDYVIIDRCAGTGNLEMFLDDGGEDILSHVILSTYELKEWIVLKDRYYGRVRYIIPPVPTNYEDLPNLNTEGFLSGANALTRDIIDNPNVRKYIDNPKCTIIMLENPPFIETTSIEFQKMGKGKEATNWKESFVVTQMKDEVKGVPTNDIANAFIWSAFSMFLRQPTDSYIVFSPIKYWKSQHLINKKVLSGFAFNKIHFHAKTRSCISCILWSNEDDLTLNSFKLAAYDIDDNKDLVYQGEINVKKVFSTLSEKYYDLRSDISDENDGIVCDMDGKETQKSEKQITVERKIGPTILGYLRTEGNTFDNPRLTSRFTIGGMYNAHGFYLRKDNFVQKLPLFASSRYTDNYNDWKTMSMIMKSGDKAEQFNADVKKGILNKFLCQTLIWTGLTHYAHLRSLNSKDNRFFYKNEICFDNLDGKTTLAREKLEEFISEGYKLSEEEMQLFDKWNNILEKTKETDEYNPKYTYGLYQIDEEINIKIQQGVKKDGTPNMVTKYGDLNNLIKDMKGMIKSYYLNNIVDKLFEYEFLK